METGARRNVRALRSCERMMVYDWKEGARFNADATKIAAELKSLDDATIEDIIKLAEDEATELHACFDWDDTVAALKWRREIAGRIPRAIVTYEEPEANEEPSYIIRAFESVTVEGRPTKAYVPIEAALTHVTWREEVYGNVDASMLALERKLEGYEHYFPEFGDMASRLRKIREDMKDKD